MAIKINHVTPSEVELTPAYVRVERVQVSKNRLYFSVLYYVSNTASIAADVTSGECSYDIDGENPIKQVYEYLKTLPEFADAIDC